MHWPLSLIHLPARLALRAFTGLIVAGCLAGTPVQAEDVVFYVVPGSNGVWFGKSSSLLAGGKEGTAESFGAQAWRVQAAGELLPALQAALDSGKVTLIDCPVNFGENLKLSERLNALAKAG